MSFRNSPAYKWYFIGSILLSATIAGVGVQYIPTDFKILFAILVGLVTTSVALEVGERLHG